MLINEFLLTHELHDSLLTKAVIKGDNLELTVDFCYWMQNEYQESNPDTGTIHLFFNKISEYSGPSGEIDDFSILAANYVDSTFTLLLLDDFNNQSYTLSFKSKSNSVSIRC